MIIDALMDSLQQAGAWLVGLLPTMNWDCSVLSGVSSYLGWIGGFVDLTAWAAVLGLVLAFEVTIWGVQGIVWVWHQVKW